MSASVSRPAVPPPAPPAADARGARGALEEIEASLQWGPTSGPNPYTTDAGDPSVGRPTPWFLHLIVVLLLGLAVVIVLFCMALSDPEFPSRRHRGPTIVGAPAPAASNRLMLLKAVTGPRAQPHEIPFGFHRQAARKGAPWKPRPPAPQPADVTELRSAPVWEPQLPRQESEAEGLSGPLAQARRIVQSVTSLRGLGGLLNPLGILGRKGAPQAGPDSTDTPPRVGAWAGSASLVQEQAALAASLVQEQAALAASLVQEQAAPATGQTDWPSSGPLITRVSFHGAEVDLTGHNLSSGTEVLLHSLDSGRWAAPDGAPAAGAPRRVDALVCAPLPETGPETGLGLGLGLGLRCQLPQSGAGAPVALVLCNPDSQRLVWPLARSLVEDPRFLTFCGLPTRVSALTDDGSENVLHAGVVVLPALDSHDGVGLPGGPPTSVEIWLEMLRVDAPTTPRASPRSGAPALGRGGPGSRAGSAGSAGSGGSARSTGRQSRASRVSADGRSLLGEWRRDTDARGRADFSLGLAELDSDLHLLRVCLRATAVETLASGLRKIRVPIAESRPILVHAR
jgi:hypothetical protein